MRSMKRSSISQSIVKRGFSDRLYWLNFKMTWCFIGVCVIITLLQGYIGMLDLTLITVGIPAAFAELGVHTAFIVEKARKENELKYGDTEAAG